MPSPRTDESPWFFITWYHSLTGVVSASWSWLFPGVRTLPDKAAGELMQRDLAHTSWFDSLAATWVSQPFSVQALTVIIVSSFAALGGLALAAPALCALCALGCCALVHVLLVSHEHHRWQRARLLATEATALSGDLEAAITHFDESTEQVRGMAQELKTQSDLLAEHNRRVDTQTAELKKLKETLELTASALSKETEALTQEQQEVKKVYETLRMDLTTLQQSISQSTLRVNGIGTSSVQLGEVVTGLKTTQTQYAEAVQRLGVFATQTEAKAVADNQAPVFTSLTAEDQALIDAQVAAAEALMGQRVSH